jgi:hypothetical protein
MSDQSYTTTFTVDATPQEAFAAINNVRDWWSGVVQGDTDRLGAQFTYEYPDMHWCRMEITEFAPGRRVAWQVVGSDLTFIQKRDEWTGTKIGFDIAEVGGKTEVHFTHDGLLPTVECYDQCSAGWNVLVDGNLRNLIESGKPQPDAFA